jgi:hypothetical protein
LDLIKTTIRDAGPRPINALVHTARGIIFDPNQLSAAHGSLPLDSYVRVTRHFESALRLIRRTPLRPGWRICWIWQTERLSFTPP